MSQEVETKVVEMINVPPIDQATNILIPEAASPDKQPVTLREGPLPTAQDLSGLFFQSPTSRPDGAFESLLRQVAEHQMMGGVPVENIKQALMLNLGAISAHLGYPLAMLLYADDPLSAARLIENSVGTTPFGWSISFDSISPAQLFVNGGGAYRNKCIVCQDSEGLTKVSGDLDLMLTRGYAVRQEILNKKYETSLEEFRAECFPSFIGIASNRKGGILTHPSIIRIPLAQGSWGNIRTAAGTTAADGYNPAMIFRIRKCFKRLKRTPVLIPFLDQIDKAVAESGVSHADILKQVVVKVISLIAIINQPPPATIAEIGSYIYETDEATVKQLLAAKTGKYIEGEAILSATMTPITATKIDYYMAKILLESFMKVGKASLTERQLKIFQTIKQYNWGKFQISMIPNASDIKKLAILAQSSDYWMDREKIFEVINKAGGEVMSLTTVNNELMELCKMGIIGREKAAKQRRYKYFVMTLDVEGSFTLPPVAGIVDPVYQGKEVNVVNPITGQIEKI